MNLQELTDVELLTAILWRLRRADAEQIMRTVAKQFATMFRKADSATVRAILDQAIASTLATLERYAAGIEAQKKTRRKHRPRRQTDRVRRTPRRR